MCCFVEVGMFVFGIVTLVKGRFQLNRTKVVVGAPAYAIGAILVSVLPVVFVIGAIVGVAAVMQTGQPIAANERFRYAWIDASVVGLALLATMGIAFANAKEPKRKSSPTPFGPSMPPPTGPLDPNNPYAAPRGDDRDRLLDDLQ